MKTQIPRGRITGYEELSEGLRLHFQTDDGQRKSFIFHNTKADRQALRDYLNWRVRKLNKTARFSSRMTNIEIIEALLLVDKLKGAAK